MDRNKARHIVTKFMKGLWPRWNLTWELQEAWTNMLAKYSEPEARRAINKVFSEGRSSVQPFPNEFSKYIRQIMDNVKALGSDVPQEAKPPPMYVLICKSDGPIGMMQYMYGAEKWSLAVRDDWLARWREKFEQLYGGTWITVQAKTSSELISLRHTLQLDPANEGWQEKQRQRSLVQIGATDSLRKTTKPTGGLMQLRPLEDLLPQAYGPEPEQQESLDDYVVENHNPNQMMEDMEDDDLPF